MTKLILARYGEIGLKGRNRARFENQLVRQMRAALRGLPLKQIGRTHGRLYVNMAADQEQALTRLSHVFGLVGVSPALQAPLELSAVKEAAARQMEEAAASGYTTFKVETRRPNKSFPLTSPEVSREVGGAILQHVPGLTVDLHAPQVTLNIELRQNYAYLYWRDIPAPGGLPVGVSGRAVLLLSGGIDSPVAGWMALSRGLKIAAVYFHSFPFTSDRARQKAIDLAGVLARYGNDINLYVISVTEIMTALRQGGPDELQTILLRRMMMRLAERVAHLEQAEALVTGESLGQVASQTLPSLAVTSAVVDMPVLRPLIGLGKPEIIGRARDIGSYDISIRPHPDCCTVFVPQFPETHPDKDIVNAKETGLIAPEIMDQALAQAEKLEIRSDWEGS